MKLYAGMIIKTNYSHRQHQVISIKRGCNCAKPSDVLGYTNTGMETFSPEHIHIRCKDMEDKMSSYFNGYIEDENDTIKSIWGNDEITIVSIPENLQLELF